MRSEVVDKRPAMNRNATGLVATGALLSALAASLRLATPSLAAPPARTGVEQAQGEPDSTERARWSTPVNTPTLPCEPGGTTLGTSRDCFSMFAAAA